MGQLAPEERQQLINEVVEKILLMIPDIIGNLMMNHSRLAKINRDFYLKYPEFSNSKDVVQTVVEVIEGKNTLESYETILEKAVPEIRKMLKQVKSLDMTTVKEPVRDLHGVL